MVPVLTTLFAYQGFHADVVVHMALGSSMAGIVLTSFASARAHHGHGAVLTAVLAPMSFGVLFGTFLASFVASQIPSKPLAIFFALFIAYISLQMLFDFKPHPARRLPGKAGLALAGMVIGAVSALVAIGGGTMTVPFLVWSNVPTPQAIGTSAALGIPISLTGTIGYIVNGWSDPHLPPFSLGYVYLPAVIGVSLTSIWFAPVGARLAHRLPVHTLKRIFAFVLLLLLAKMLYTLFSGA